MYCPMCEHDIKYHYYVPSAKLIVCKLRECKCLRRAPESLMYSEKLAEQLK